MVEHLARAVQLHPHGVEFDLADLCDFLGRHVFQFKEHQHGSVFFGQVVENPMEQQARLLLL